MGLLAALAIPRFTNARENAAKTTVLADARSIYSELEILYAENGRYPTDAELPDETALSGSYTGDLTYSQTSNTAYTATYVNSEGTWEIEFTNTGVGDIDDVSAPAAP